MQVSKRIWLVGIAMMLLCVLASCSGGGGTSIPAGQATVITLASGGGATFPAAAFAAGTDVEVTEDIPGAARNAASFPANSGDLLGAIRVTVPTGVALATDIEVRIAMGAAMAANTEFTIFQYNGAAGMWETTAVSAVRNVAATGLIANGNLVTFNADTAGSTGLDATWGVFANFNTPGEGGGTVNTIPTVTLAADATTVDVDTTVNLTATGADADGDTLTYSWNAAAGTLGTGTTTNTWSAGAGGAYTIGVKVDDGNGGVAVDSVNVTVNAEEVIPVNDPPTFAEGEAIAGDVAAPVVGQKVWLTGVHAEDPEEEAITYTWSGPGTFADETEDEHGVKVFWTPDAEGDATVTLTASDGENEITLDYEITVAVFPTAFDFVGYATCVACHPQGDEAAGTGFFGTNHMNAIERSLSDPTNAHAFRNPSCYACHALGWAPNDTGQGFVDIDLTPEFRNIQCESCHGGGATAGAGAGHKTVNWQPMLGMVFDEVEGVWIIDETFDATNGVGCGRCHEGARHGAGEEWAQSGHANFALLEDDGTGTMIPDHYLTSASCAKCHSGKEYVRVQAKGGDPAEAPEILVEDVEDHLISCATCHDPHAADNEKQLRFDNVTDVAIPFSDTDNVPTMVNGGWGNICITCHNGRRDRGDYDDRIINGSGHFGPHGNPQGAMFFGVMGADLGAPGDYEYEHPHLTWNENTCISCHMFRQPYVSSDEPARFGHEFHADFRNCVKCHTNYTLDDEEAFWLWVEEYQTDDIGMLLAAFVDAWPAAWKDVTDPDNPVLENRDTDPATGVGPPIDDALGNGYREALWNYYLVLNDATVGVHNPTFTKDLLIQAIQRVEELNAL